MEDAAVIIAINGDRILVDQDNYAAYSKLRWSTSSGYARTGSRESEAYMHRMIMNPEKGMQIDHISGNTLDNRRCNLRICTQKQNAMNRKKKSDGRTSIYKGVSYTPRDKPLKKPWKVKANGKHVAFFATEIEAAKAYNDAVLECYGEFAKLNVIPES